MSQAITFGSSLGDTERGTSLPLVRMGDVEGKNSVELHMPQMIREGQCCESNGLNLATMQGRCSSTASSSNGTPMEPGTLIDIDELEDIDHLWNDEPDLQILRVQKRRASRPGRKSSKFTIPKRNLPIEAPFRRLLEWQYKNMRLRPSKTVELFDGDFLVITDLIQHSNLGEITLRGHRLQRCRSMNGLLEKKLNEVCFFHEVDLDDERPPHEQSVVEVTLDTVKGLRILRKTNQRFPLCRSLSLRDFWSQADAATQGGLTARWKYTCTYSSEADRWNNNPKERSLEFLREDECTKDSDALDEMRRFDWRGDTVPGGSFRPEIEGKPSVEGLGRDSVISLASSNAEPDSDCTIIDSPTASVEARSSGERKAPSISFSLPTSSRKRRASSVDDEELSRKSSKRPRFENGDDVEITRRGLSELSVDEKPSALRDEDTVDLPDTSSSSQRRQLSSQQTHLTRLPLSKHGAAIKVSPTIDLSSSDLASPPRTGSISCGPVSVKAPVIRSAGQMLTYGDAFCGCGGTTRGAVMAGLRVKWGFDYWAHACSTWRANFPQATCYELSSEEFVRKAQGEKWRKPVDVKVDILHLSPPCQYFSPAHTVNCPKDEFNVASLYAVDAVIKVAKPRVVTLEQTFGLVAVKHRKYFNSLIHMFTSIGFSIRWAIVPLAQWVSSNPLSDQLRAS
jgi:DNA (cytosine-5)-methyltransferase 1